jgi:hypothetical protein
VFRFCIETEYARASTPVNCVALWVLRYVCAYVSVRKWGCRSGGSLTPTTPLELDVLTSINMLRGEGGKLSLSLLMDGGAAAVQRATTPHVSMTTS